MWSFFSNARSEINGLWSGPKKSPLQKTSEVDTNYDCRQGNKWGHQLGCEFQSSRYVNLCLKGALINYLQPLWCGWYTPAYLSDLYSPGLWSRGSICEAYIYTWTWKPISCNRQSLYSLLEQIDAFGNLKRAGVHLTGFTCANKIRDDEWTAYVNVKR